MSKAIRQILDKYQQEINVVGSEFLLGSVDIDKHQYELVICSVKDLLVNDLILKKKERILLISIALVQFAIKEFHSGHFWEEFAFKVDLDESVVQRICKRSFENCCSLYSLYFHIGKKNKGYVTSILLHSILIEASSDKFMEFLSELYFKDLEEDYVTEEVQGLTQYMHKLFSRYVDEDDINLNIQGSKMTIANQQLPKSFRIAFVKSPSIVAPVIGRLLFYVDKIHYNESFEYKMNDRFDEYFQNHKKAWTRISDSNKRRSRKTDGQKRYHVAQYILLDKKLHLVIPRQIIDSEYIENAIFVEINTKKGNIHRSRLFITQSKLFFKSEEKVIRVDDFYPEITYKITSGEEIIYNSKNLLYRDFIVFDFEGREINPKKVTSQPYKIVTKRSAKIISDTSRSQIIFQSNYKMLTMYFDEDSYVIINGKILSTKSFFMGSGLDKEFRNLDVEIVDSFNNRYDVYSRIPKIRIWVSNRSNIESFIASINGHNIRIKDIASHEMIQIEDGSGDSLVVLKVNEGILTNNNPFSITIREKGKSKLYVDERVFILKSFEYKFSKDFYYQNSTAHLIKMSSNEVQFLNDKTFPLSIDLIKNEKLIVDIIFKDDRYSLHINLPVIKWNIGLLSSDCIDSKYIWWGDFQVKELNLISPIVPKALIAKYDGEYERLDFKKKGFSYQFDLSCLFKSLNKRSVELEVVYSNFRLPITTVIFKPRITNLDVSVYDEEFAVGLFASWQFVGKGDVFADVICKPSNHLIKTYNIENNCGIVDKYVKLSQNDHILRVYIKEQDDFFGESEKKIILAQKEFVVGDELIYRSNMEGVCISKCICDSNEYKMKNFYIENIKKDYDKESYYGNLVHYYYDRTFAKWKKWIYYECNPICLTHREALHNGNHIFRVYDKKLRSLILDLETNNINPKKRINNRFRYRHISKFIVDLSWKEKENVTGSCKSIKEHNR